MNLYGDPISTLNWSAPVQRPLSREDQLLQSPNLEVITSGEVETATLRSRIRLPVLMDNDQSQRLRQTLSADYFVLGTFIAYRTITDQYSGIIPVAGITLQAPSKE